MAINFTDEAKFVDEFYRSNPTVKNNLEKLFGNSVNRCGFWKEMRYDIVKSISDHKRLFTKYSKKEEFGKYYDIEVAIKNVIENDKILIYFSDLKLFATVNSLTIFRDFLIGMRDLVDDEEIVNLNQVVLSDHNQKMVLAYSGDEKNIADIQKYSKEHFGTDSTISKGENGIELTIDKTATYDEFLVKFASLQEYIRGKGTNLEKTISLLERFSTTHYKYTHPNINAIINETIISEIAKLFKQLPSGIQIQQLNIGVENVINGNVVNNIIESFDDKKSFADNWIKNNLPANKEITTIYYEKYKKASKFPLHNNQFGKIVSNNGFCKKSDGNKRYWIKN